MKVENDREEYNVYDIETSFSIYYVLTPDDREWLDSETYRITDLDLSKSFIDYCRIDVIKDPYEEPKKFSSYDLPVKFYSFDMQFKFQI